MNDPKSDELPSQDLEHSRVRTGKKWKRTARRWAFIGMALILLTFLVVMLAPDLSRPDPRSRTAAVCRNNLIVTVTESGTLAARRSIVYKCQMYNNPAIINLVPEGTYITPEDVNKGRVLVELDPSAAQERLDAKQMDLIQVQAEITQAREDCDIQLTQNESDITAALLAVEFAWMDVEKYVGSHLSDGIRQKLEADPNAVFEPASWLNDPNALGGEAGQTYSKLNDAITLANARLTRAQDVLGSTQKLYDVNYVSLMKLEGDQLDVNSNRIQYQQTQEELELFKTYYFAKQAKSLLSAYQEALRGLSRIRAKARGREVQARSQVASRESRLEMVQKEVHKLEEQIRASKIRATAAGLLIHETEYDMFGNYRVMINEGARIRYNQKIISLPDISEMIVKVGLPESTVDQVRVGQKAVITIDAFLDRRFHGKVLHVAILPEKNNIGRADVKAYTAEISIVGSYDFLKPGMSANVEILTNQLNDVMVVPIQAVVFRQDKRACFVSGRGNPELREVVTGAFNKTSVQIIEGLTEGEEVILNPPRRYNTNTETIAEPNKTDSLGFDG